MTNNLAAELRTKRCQSCEEGVPPLAQDEVTRLHAAVPHWQLVNERKALRRTWRVKDFVTAIDFFRRISDVAEADDHHPDLHLTGYRDVAIEIYTHAIGGLSENDFILAAKIDLLPVELKT
jgi:4a-hydroxytetrahydrobiopterin dehydratase